MFKTVQASPAYRMAKGLISSIAGHFSYNSQTAKWSYLRTDPTSAENAAAANVQAMIIDERVFVQQTTSSITAAAGLTATASMTQAYNFFSKDVASYFTSYECFCFPSDLERLRRQAVQPPARPNMSPNRPATEDLISPQVLTLVQGLYDVMNQQWDVPTARSFLASVFQLAMEAASEATKAFDTHTSDWKRSGLVSYIRMKFKRT